MKTSTGLWIDHKEAVVITLNGIFHHVTSQVEKNPSRAQGAVPGPYESQKVKASDRRQRILSAELKTFYDEVVGCLPESNTLLVFGPGEAKREFQHELLDKKPGIRVTVETADSMTEPQMLARVRDWAE